MAVLVQAMAPHEASGVTLGAAPISSDRDSVVVEAAAGLGEQVVGGEVVPDRWTVRGDTVDNLAGGQRGSCLPDDAVRELAALVRAIEAHFEGEPQDVECSYGQGRFHLLQSRPITTLQRRGEPS